MCEAPTVKPRIHNIVLTYRPVARAAAGKYDPRNKIPAHHHLRFEKSNGHERDIHERTYPARIKAEVRYIRTVYRIMAQLIMKYFKCQAVK